MNRISKLLVPCMIVVIGFSACGNDEVGPGVQWGKIYGGNGYDTGQAVAETSDGGFIVVGFSDSFFQDAVRIYLLRLDNNGDTLWTDTHGSTNTQAFAIEKTSDGNYVIAGYSESSGNGDVLLVKINEEGSVLWERTYGGPGSDIGLAVNATNDGGLIVAGWTRSDSTGDQDVYLIKTDGAGDTVWTQVYGGNLDDFGTSVHETSDGGFIICGWTESYGAGSDDVYLIRASSNGDTLWTRTYGDQNQDYGEAVIETVNGTYVITGVTQDANEAMSRIFMLELDSSGDTIWLQTYDDGFGYDVKQTTDNGFILVGSHFSEFPIRNAYLLKTDANGIIAWEKSFGGDANDAGFAVHQVSDNGYILVGETESFGAGSRDVYIMKTVPESE